MAKLNQQIIILILAASAVAACARANTDTAVGCCAADTDRATYCAYKLTANQRRNAYAYKSTGNQ